MPHDSSSGKSKWGLSKWGLKALVHNCPRLPTIVVILRRKFPLERGPKRPQKCTIVDDCAQIAESGLKPPFESPHLDFPDKFFVNGARIGVEQGNPPALKFCQHHPLVSLTCSPTLRPNNFMQASDQTFMSESLDPSNPRVLFGEDLAIAHASFCCQGHADNVTLFLCDPATNANGKSCLICRSPDFVSRTSNDLHETTTFCNYSQAPKMGGFQKGGFRKRAEYCFESAVSEKRTH